MAFKNISGLATIQLLQQRAATRRKRHQLLSTAKESPILADANIQRIAVWEASCASVDTTGAPFEELPVAPGEPSRFDASEDDMDSLADTLVREALGLSAEELTALKSNPMDEFYAKGLAYASIKIEAELLRRSIPGFSKTPEELAAFELCGVNTFAML